MDASPRIGFIGQGYVGKNYADNFEARGFDSTRYALEEPFRNNKDLIKECDIVFIGVPTPTTPEGFDSSIVREAIKLVGEGKIAVIKSTVLPGTTATLQKEFSDRVVLFSPEYLSEVTASQDVEKPFASIVGMGEESVRAREAAERVLKVLPEAPFSLICTSTEAEIAKYVHNLNGYFQVIFFNLMYDITQQLGGSWEVIQSAVMSNPTLNPRYASPVHQSGRGAGGHCFIKDLAAFQKLYQQYLPEDTRGIAFFEAAAQKNIELLRGSGKSLDLLAGVYGEDVLTKES